MNSKASYSELCEYALRINEQIQIKALASMLLDGDASEEEYESQGEVLASDENSDGEDGFDASESEEADTVSLIHCSRLSCSQPPRNQGAIIRLGLHLGLQGCGSTFRNWKLF
jgi:hypothetical protein